MTSVESRGYNARITWSVLCRWPDILELKYKKRSLELSIGEEIIVFDLEDKQSAKYTWEALIEQHKFHRMQTAGGKALPIVSLQYRPHLDRSMRGGTPQDRQSSFVRKKTLSKSSSIMESVSHISSF
jgi:NMD protein affecting ribosome stability and mRNA decay